MSQKIKGDRPKNRLFSVRFISVFGVKKSKKISNFFRKIFLNFLELYDKIKHKNRQGMNSPPVVANDARCRIYPTCHIYKAAIVFNDGGRVWFIRENPCNDRFPEKKPGFSIPADAQEKCPGEAIATEDFTEDFGGLKYHLPDKECDRPHPGSEGRESPSAQCNPLL